MLAAPSCGTVPKPTFMCSWRLTWTLLAICCQTVYDETLCNACNGTVRGVVAHFARKSQAIALIILTVGISG